MTAAEYLLDLIRIPSVSALSNRAVVDYAKGALHKAGWSTRELAYFDSNNIEKVNLIAAPLRQDVSVRSVDLAFVCHTDTVPFSASWAGALEPYCDEEFLYGCGACDVKGFLACLLQAAASGSRANWSEGLRIVLTADEEIGCVGATHLFAQDAIRPKRLVIGEPTSLHVARAGKGYCLSEVEVHGIEAHSAHPEQGASAIFAASRMIRSIEELAVQLRAQTHELFCPAYTSVNVGTIQGGTAKNIIAGECRFLVEWRPVPGLDADFIPAALQSYADTLQQSDPSIQCTIHALRRQACFETAVTSALVQTLVEKTGLTSTSIPFGSEASVFAPIAEEMVVFGPGNMQTAHSDRECVPLGELKQAVAVLSGLMVPDVL
ncbi:MAG: M20/M25/M40 family metallo-hydrolase [Acidobacteriota bacterium]|nr:M20/M25/M40 family metallo-hydrolase [Acidobacteriota bacterium]